MRNDFLKFVEVFIWLVLPITISMFILVKSALLTRKTNKVLNWIFSATIFILILFSDYILYVIYAQDAWPTIIPHIAITVSLVLFLFQYYINKKIFNHTR